MAGRTVVCPNCEHRNGGRSNFCSECGEELRRETPASPKLSDEDVDRIATKTAEKLNAEEPGDKGRRGLRRGGSEE